MSRYHRPPVPGALLASSGFFALCAVLAEYQPARGAATLLAFGIDIAAWLQAPFITPAAGEPETTTGESQTTAHAVTGG